MMTTFKNIILLFLVTVSFITHAQVSMITSGFTQNLTKEDLPFGGDRKLYAVGINDKNTENYFVVSKNHSGAGNDELYLEKFTIEGDRFSRTFHYKLTHPVNKSLAFVDNRATYTDVDKDGNYESISIIDQHKAGPDSNVERVIGVILYKNTAYEIWVTAEDQFSKNYFSPNFSVLPLKIKDHFVAFWDGLNKR